MKHSLIAALLALASATIHAADGSPSSRHGISQAVGSVAVGASLAVVGAVSMTVESVRTVGDGVELVLKGASDGSSAVVQVSEGAALAAGTAVSVVAMSAGHALVASGKVIAFLPNEVGKALLHHSRVH